MLDASSSKARWAAFQVVAAAGIGLALSTMLPAILTALPKSDVATATGMFSVVRSFGTACGITLPSIIFNNQFGSHSRRIEDEGVRAFLSNGSAYSHASGDYVTSLSPVIQHQVIEVFVVALKTIWQVVLNFCLVAFLCVFVQKHFELRKDLNTEFSLEGDSRNKSPDKLQTPKKPEVNSPLDVSETN